MVGSNAMKGRVLRGGIGQWVILTLAFGFFSSLWVFNNPTTLESFFGNSAVAVEANAITARWHLFDSPSLGVSILYPPEYTVDSSYVYTELGPRSGIKGVKFTIPESKAEGTNLSHADSGVSIEILPNADACTGAHFVEEKIVSDTLKEKNVTYSIAKTAGAGAGNYYEETVYALTDSVPCTAVRYFIHSTNINNYEPGTVTAFDKKALLKEFDAMRQSLVLIREK